MAPLLVALAALSIGSSCERRGRAEAAPSEVSAAAVLPPSEVSAAAPPADAAGPEDLMSYDAFHGLVETRRSIRQYAAAEVDDAAVERILAAVRLCPTAGNLQAYEVVVVRDPHRRAALAAAAGGQPWVEQAPVVLAFVARPAVSGARYDERGSELYAVQDATIATTYAMLAATSLGWGSVWVGAFDTAAAARALDCTEGEIPVALLPVGRAAESPPARPRRAVEELSRHL